MSEEIKINKYNKSISFIHNNIAFSQFGVADEILDLITDLQNELQQKENIIKEDLLKIINHYGLSNQLKYIHSEYFELDEAIIKYEDYVYENYEYGVGREHIAEEISDIMVILKQFQYYYDIKDSEIEKIMLEKIQRQLGRMEGDKE